MSLIAVWGPPQSGKTTLSIDLAYALSQQGKSVCLISPEPYSELTARMGIRIIHNKSLDQAYSAIGNLQQTVLEADDLLYVLAVPWDHDAYGEEASADACKELLKQAQTVFDFIIVDCPSKEGEMLAAWSLSMADRVLMLSGGSETASMWYNSFKKAVDAVSSRSMIVCVEVNESYDYLSLCKLIQKNPDVFVSHYPNAAKEQQSKKTLYGIKSKIGKAYTESIHGLCEKMEVGA